MFLILIIGAGTTSSSYGTGTTPGTGSGPGFWSGMDVWECVVLMFDSGCMYRSCYWWDAGVSVWKSWKVSSSIISYIILCN